jgi:superfamily II DNA/RNA helicase
MARHGFNVGALHGDMDQKSRMDTLAKFKSGELKILIASDVAARGLDIPNVSHVFNYDIPIHAEDYVHRIGRTGRAGRSGKAFSLIAPTDNKYLEAIETLIVKKIEWVNNKEKNIAKPADDVSKVKQAKKPAQKHNNQKHEANNRQKHKKTESDNKNTAPNNSPFGNFGPTPAFLLQSTAKIVKIEK